MPKLKTLQSHIKSPSGSRCIYSTATETEKLREHEHARVRLEGTDFIYRHGRMR